MGEYLIVEVAIVFGDPPRNGRSDQNNEHADYNAYVSKDVKNIAEVLEDMMKPRG